MYTNKVTFEVLQAIMNGKGKSWLCNPQCTRGCLTVVTEKVCDSSEYPLDCLSCFNYMHSRLSLIC